MAIILSNWRPASNREGLVPARRRCPYYVKLFRPWLLLLLPSTASFPTMCSAENRGHEASLLRGHFITCVSCGEGQGRLVAQSVLVLPHQQQSRTTHIFQICRSRYHSSLIQTLSPRVCVCDSSDIGKLNNKYARSEDTTLKYQTGHARAWPLIGYILSCLVSPCRRRQPSTSDPPVGAHVALVSQPTTAGSRDHLSITIQPPQPKSTMSCRSFLSYPDRVLV